MANKKKNISKPKTRRKAIRSINADTRGHIVSLAEILYEFLPLNTRNPKAESLRSIFKASNIQSYIPDNVYKKQAVETALIKLFRYHQKIPFTIFRKVIPASVKWRSYKHKPLTRQEVNRLGSILLQLEIDLTDEFNAIDLEQFNTAIVVPPNELIKRLDSHSLCEQISSGPLYLFKNGHFNEAVRKATERFEVEIQNRTSSSDIGKTLMHRTFNIKAPIIALNALTTGNERSVQEGYQSLTAGTMQAMRNIFSHGDEDQRPAEEAYEMLLFINWLFRQLPA